MRWALAAALLAGCSMAEPPIHEIQTVTVSPPLEIMNCEKLPLPPAGDYAQSALADWLLQVLMRQEACQDSMNAVRDYVTKQNPPAK